MAVKLIIIENPFDSHGSRKILEDDCAGLSISQIHEKYGSDIITDDYVASINHKIAEPEQIVSDKDEVVILPVIGKSDKDKEYWRTGLSVAVSAAAIYFSAGAATPLVKGAWAAAAVAANYAIGRYLAPDLLQNNTEAVSGQTYSFDGPRNNITEGASLPILYGERWVAPPIISNYTDNEDDDQRLNLLMAIGEGEITVDTVNDVKINGNIWSTYDGVSEPELRTGTVPQTAINGFQAFREEQYLGTTIPADYDDLVDGNWGPYSVEEDLGIVDSTYLDFEIFWPQGLFRYSDNGQVVSVGGGYDLVVETWDTVNGWRILARFDHNHLDPLLNTRDTSGSYPIITVGQSTTPIRRTVRFTNDSVGSQWKVRAAIQYNSYADIRSSEDAFKRSYIKAFINKFQAVDENTYTYNGVALLAVKAMATDQLYGNQFSILAKASRSNLSIWNGTTTLSLPSSNPAWACLDLIQNNRYGAGIDSDHPAASAMRSNYTEFQDWASFCTTKGYTCNIYLDDEKELGEWLNIIAQAGRGVIVQRGTSYGVIIDRDNKVPSQIFNISNIDADSFEETFISDIDRADVIEVTYFDEDRENERTMFELSSEDYDSITTNPRKMSVILYGVTDREQAVKYAKYLLNTNQYLHRTISFNADMDSIAVEPGDVIGLQHDVPGYGEGGRVVSGTSTTVTFDHEIEFSSSITYSVSMRDNTDDSLYTEEIINPGDVTTDTVTIASGTWGFTPEADDLYAIGETDIQYKEFKVTSVDRTGDLVATINAIEYRAEIYSDTAVIPDYPSGSYLAPVRNLRLDDVYPPNENGVIRPGISITWDGEAVAWYAYWRLGAFYPWRYLGRFDQREAYIENAIIGQTYQIAVSDDQNPENGLNDFITVEVDPPSEVRSLSAETFDNQVRLDWVEPIVTDLEVSKYLIRKGTDFATSAIVGEADKTFTTFFESAAGTYTYWVQAVDAAGNKSGAVSITTDVNMTVEYKFPTEYDDDFQGTGTNMLITDDYLLIPLDTTETWNEHFENNSIDNVQGFIDNPDYEYWFQPDGATSGQYVSAVIDTGASIPSGVVTLDLDYEAYVGTISDLGFSPTIEYSPDNVTWSSLNTGVFSGNFTNARYFRYTLDVNSTQLSEAKINDIKLIINLPRTTQQGNDNVSVAASGKVIDITGLFIQVDSIVVTPNGSTSQNSSVQFTYSTLNPTSFTVFLYDSSGVKTTGNFAWVARGV